MVGPMLTLEQAATPFDLVRGATLRFTTRSRLVTRILARRDTRIAALGSLQVLVLLAATLRFPVALYFVGPVVLGVVHLAADVRYLCVRVTPPKALWLASAVLAGALTVVRVCVGLHVASATLGAQVDMGVGSVWVGVALALRVSDAASSFRTNAVMLAIVAGTALAARWLMTHAALCDVVIVHGHNLLAFVLWFALFRPRASLGWAALPMVLVVAASAVLLSGAWVPWTSQHGGLLAFGQRAARLGAGLAPGASSRVATAVAMTFVFLQSVHYAVWTNWIPQDCLPGEGTATFRMTLRSLKADFGPRALALIAFVTVGFGLLACWHLRQSVAWYMTLARAHVWFELAVFVYFVGRPGVMRTAT